MVQHTRPVHTYAATVAVVIPSLSMKKDRSRRPQHPTSDTVPRQDCGTFGGGDLSFPGLCPLCTEHVECCWFTAAGAEDRWMASRGKSTHECTHFARKDSDCASSRAGPLVLCTPIGIPRSQPRHSQDNLSQGRRMAKHASCRSSLATPTGSSWHLRAFSAID